MIKMSKKAISTVLGIFSLSISANAGTIVSGRPGDAIGAGTLEKGYLQYQSGISYTETTDIDEKISGTSHGIRSAFFDNLEFAGVFSYSNDDLSENTNGVDNYNYGFGFRYKIRGGDTLPLAFQFRIVDRNNITYHQSILSTAVGVSSKWSLGLNLKFSDNIDSSSVSHRVGYAASLSRSLTQKLGFFIENYGTYTNDRLFTYLDSGFSYLINDDLQADFSAGYGNSYSQETWFVSIGLSGRFNVL